MAYVGVVRGVWNLRSMTMRQDQFIPQLIVIDGSRAMDFYKRAFGAEEVSRTISRVGARRPASVGHRADSATLENRRASLFGRSVLPRRCCPRCGKRRPARRVHDRGLRPVLPWYCALNAESAAACSLLKRAILVHETVPLARGRRRSTKPPSRFFREPRCARRCARASCFPHQNVTGSGRHGDRRECRP
jgi:hypothetical protein